MWLPLNRAALLFCALALTVGCGLSRYTAERNYLGQMLYDYAYAAPLVEVWPAAMSAFHASPDAGVAEPWGRSFQAHGLAEVGHEISGGNVVAIVLPDGGTRLNVLLKMPDAGPLAPSIFQARNFDAELKIMRLIAPKDAESFYSGSLQAGRRADRR